MKTDREKNFVSCIIYLHNDEDAAADFLRRVCRVMHQNFEKYEVICVNDDCSDATVKQLRTFLEESREKHVVSLINLSFYQGVESAMNAGRDIAVGDFLFEFDRCLPDFEDDLIMEVYRRALEGYDVVAAAPKNKVPFTSRLFYRVFSLGNSRRAPMRQERFRIISRRAVNRVGQLNTYIPYRKALYMNCGLKSDTIAYDNKPCAHRARGREELDNRSTLAMDSIIIFTDLLEKLSLGLSVLFFAALVFMGGYLIVSFFSEQKPVEGWLSLMGLMSFGFFMLFVMLTLIFKYLSVILNMSFRRQQYVVESVEKL